MSIYLCVKQHAITKLKYFCKTTSKNPEKYRGSGKYWKNHINKHGKDHVITLHIWEFDNQLECTEFALKYSIDNDIVKSEEWANLILEDGKRGGSIKGRIFTEEHKQNMRGKIRSKEHCDNIRKNHTKPNLGKKLSSATREKMSRNNVGFRGKKHSDLTKEKMSKALKGVPKNFKLSICPHCLKEGSGPNMSRYHFDNCKSLVS